jgi:hypothetical protein
MIGRETTPPLVHRASIEAFPNTHQDPADYGAACGHIVSPASPDDSRVRPESIEHLSSGASESLDNEHTIDALPEADARAVV